jgi:hypothetical protein
MPPLPVAVVSLSVCLVVATLGAGHAQEIVKDPHVQPPSIEAPQYVLVDDVLLTTEQLGFSERIRTQATPIDFTRTIGAWDFGVIPYQISPDFTSQQHQNIVTALEIWVQVAPIRFVPRTTQSGYLVIVTTTATSGGSPCFSTVGQATRGVRIVTNLGGNCASALSTTSHELGHAVGLFHEHSRADRDDYIEIDLDNVAPVSQFAFRKLTLPLTGTYDFGSVMHYSPTTFAIDPQRPVIKPLPQYASMASVMGRAPRPSALDHAGVAFLYNSQLRPSAITRPTLAPTRTFARNEFLLAMERLHALYMSRYGLHRDGGLSIAGRPDFLGIAQWIFDIYLGARSSGWSPEGAFDIVIAAVTQTDEWRQKNAGRGPLTPAAFLPSISFNRDEFLSVMNRLDAFYKAPEGLQRPDGLSLNRGPDFLGLATWIFDIYLAERLRGVSPEASWTITENAIKATDEWRRKH